MAQQLDPALMEALKRAQTTAKGVNVLPQPQAMPALSKGIYGPYVAPPSLGSDMQPPIGGQSKPATTAGQSSSPTDDLNSKSQAQALQSLLAKFGQKNDDTESK